MPPLRSLRSQVRAPAESGRLLYPRSRQSVSRRSTVNVAQNLVSFVPALGLVSNFKCSHKQQRRLWLLCAISTPGAETPTPTPTQ